MSDKEYLVCPKHNVTFKRKSITYNLVWPEMDENIMLAGYSVPKAAPQYGYACPICYNIYYADKTLLYDMRMIW